MIFLNKMGVKLQKEKKHLEEGNDILKSLTEYKDTWEEKSARNWNEERDREKWDKVKEFAENLRLLPNEEYWICGPDTYEKGKELEIAHLINGYGSYPPGEEGSPIPPLGD